MVLKAIPMAMEHPIMPSPQHRKERRGLRSQWDPSSQACPSRSKRRTGNECRRPYAWSPAGRGLEHRNFREDSVAYQWPGRLQLYREGPLLLVCLFAVQFINPLNLKKESSKKKKREKKKKKKKKKK